VAAIRIGIDIGGTFTDLQILDEATGRLHSLKTPTTPSDPSLGLLEGLREAARRYGFAFDDIRLLLHGTTIATNAVLERRLARGMLITTQGFTDVLEIGRHARRDVYGLNLSRDPPLIPRDRRVGVLERMRGDGSVEQPLDAGAVQAALAQVGALGAEAVAVMLLNAHINPAHEQDLARQIAQAYPGLPFAISSAVSPEIREYERVSTTVLNALLMPVVGPYLAGLTQRLADAGVAARLLLVQSNGGVCSAEMAAQQPVRLLLSGPSGGALAARRLAEVLQRPNLIGGDMGGTSFDVCIIQEGRMATVAQGEVGGLPVRLPMVEIRTIGAGGGSIAAVDSGARLTVGPRSAGAQPGPVCYGRGGTAATVTDANVALGRLDPGFFLGGAMALDRAGAMAAIARDVADPLGLDTERAAEGLLTVTNAHLAAAIRLSLFEKGLDPRRFSLLSFGGAGGLHATGVAEELGVSEVIFPADASTFSAYGILQSDIVHDLARSRVLSAAEDSLPAIRESVAALRRLGTELLAQDAVPEADRSLTLAADMRYRGQAFELLVPWLIPGGDIEPEPQSLGRLMEDFHHLHRQRFSYANPEDAVEIVTLRLAASGRLAAGRTTRATPPGAMARNMGRRRVYCDGLWQELPVHWRPGLAEPVAGPALIEEEYTTVFIGRSWSCRLGEDGALIAWRIAG
jgi:N-methylhydantoinase A